MARASPALALPAGSAMALGSFVLTLHGHLPWVLHHGQRPHGVHWLYEAADRKSTRLNSSHRL